MAGRPVTTGTEAHRARQRRYRARLDAAMIPEADDCDRALLHELRGYAYDVARGRDVDDGRLKSLLLGALDRLERLGYDRRQASKRLVRRLGAPPPDVRAEFLSG